MNTRPAWWRRLPFVPGAERTAPFTTSMPRPDPPVCVIGDVHGCDSALGALLEIIKARPGAETARLIFVGDLVDRGPDSKQVLARIRAMTAAEPRRVTCLMGNHEAMLIEALADPAAMTRWLVNGGDATLASFGVSARRPREDTGTAWHAELVAALRAAWPAGTEDWLRALPLYWQEGELAVAHAAGDPDRLLEDQGPETLLWGHRNSLRRARADGVWIAHGHWVFDCVNTEAGRISVDTGAWRTGVLSAAWFESDGFSSLSNRSTTQFA